MKTNTYTKPENFIDFEAPDAEKTIDKLLVKAEKTPTLSFEESFKKNKDFLSTLKNNF